MVCEKRSDAKPGGCSDTFGESSMNTPAPAAAPPDLPPDLLDAVGGLVQRLETAGAGMSDDPLDLADSERTIAVLRLLTDLGYAVGELRAAMVMSLGRMAGSMPSAIDVGDYMRRLAENGCAVSVLAIVREAMAMRQLAGQPCDDLIAALAGPEGKTP